ncbi:hypothetical protein K504DRAFT_500997 [Pleomassaria siparia CBS 279.74]|uniref:Uncharacterized protein n=1 Tax=Pleomassaria siparia CBS 279.74 TaxID=1314801 RepID=A0A6G1KEK6_9PLEO|nr:hypothetical protein K504DRAFT_500997 [Pleomassaria siparia CBS 279.74]
MRLCKRKEKVYDSDVVVECARVVKVTPSPINGRCSILNGIVRDCPYNTPVRDTLNITPSCTPKPTTLHMPSAPQSSSPQESTNIRDALCIERTAARERRLQPLGLKEMPSEPAPNCMPRDVSGMLNEPSPGTSSSKSPPRCSESRQTGNHVESPPRFELPATQTPEVTYLNLLVGLKDPTDRYRTQRPFQIRYSLVQTSKVLSALESYPLSHRGSMNDTHHVIPTIDPDAFNLYIRHQSTGPYSYPGACSMRKARWDQCLPFINAHILGITIEDTGFADLMLDRLSVKIDPTQCADAETIAHIFTSAGSSEGLKKLLVDGCIQHIDVLLRYGWDDLPRAFSDAVLRVMLPRLKHAVPQFRSGCEYHAHGYDEPCYRYTNPVPPPRHRPHQGPLSLNPVSPGPASRTTQPTNGVLFAESVDRRNGSRAPYPEPRPSSVREASESPIRNGTLTNTSLSLMTSGPSPLSVPLEGLLNGKSLLPTLNGTKEKVSATEESPDNPADQEDVGIPGAGPPVSINGDKAYSKPEANGVHNDVFYNDVNSQDPSSSAIDGTTNKVVKNSIATAGHSPRLVNTIKNEDARYHARTQPPTLPTTNGETRKFLVNRVDHDDGDPNRLPICGPSKTDLDHLFHNRRLPGSYPASK